MAIIRHSHRDNLRRPSACCQRTDLLWAHDTSVPNQHGTCKECAVDGKYVLIERNGTRHDCGYRIQ